MITHIIVALLVLINLQMLGSSRLGGLIRAVALEALLMGFLTLVIHTGQFTWYEWVVIGSTITVKSVLLPLLLKRALHETVVRRDVEPLVGYSLSLFFGLLFVGISALAVVKMPMPPIHTSPLVIMAGMLTVCTGLFLIITRTKAITQTIGYLVLENGIYALGIALAAESPFIVELGILLDVFVGVFVMGIMIENINREFDNIDTTQLTSLKD
ncbi:MAG: hydrogenase [Desulfoplanes sp.]